MRLGGASLAWARVGSVLVLVVGVFGLNVPAGTRVGSPSVGVPGPRDKGRVEAMLGKLPLSFVENRGQEDPRVAFSMPGRDTTLYFTRDGVTFALTSSRTRRSSEPFVRVAASRAESTARERWSVKLDFVGANPAVVPRGQDLTPAPVSYFKGPESRWKTGLRTYASVVYADLWPGIDMVYSGTAGRLKYTLLVKPGADPGRIKLAYRGATAVTLTGAGRLDVTTPVGGFSDDQPYAYQESGGARREIPASYDLAADSRTYGFKVGAYDRNRPLVLDPSFLVYAGYIGGSGIENANAIAVDSAGNAYVAGITNSTVPSFPGTIGPDLTFNGRSDAFVAKVKADGTGLVYAGYIGGAGDDVAKGIAVDSAGNAYVTGETTSDETTFPVKVGPGLTFNGGTTDAFVAKVKADGTGLVYAGYIGGAGDEEGTAIGLDSAGNAYVTGVTTSDETTFPVKVGPDLTSNGDVDAFVAKVKADGTGFVYAGYIGGADLDFANAIDVDSAGNAYVVGETASDQASFPTKVGPQLAFNGGAHDAFVAKVKADGTALVYAGYIGGAGDDFATAVAVDSAGNAYVAGDTSSTQTTFPVRVGPDLTFNGGTDSFVAKVKPDGSAFVYAGFIGGNGSDNANAIAVDSAGSAYVTGTSTSTSGFPIRVGPDFFNNGGIDIFVVKVRPDGTGLLYGGFLGGAADDRANSIAVDSAGNAYIAGTTSSDQTSFPVTVGPDLLYNGGVNDGFVLKVSGKPNLFDGAPTIPSFVKPGGSFLAISTAFNQGLGTAPHSTTRYYLSLDHVKSGGDILLTGSKAVASLEPGAASGGSATVTVPASTPLGSYFVLACADDTNAVAELDETDNCGPSFSSISVTLPDLLETPLSSPPSSANPGNRFTVTDRVQNLGSVGAGTSTTRYYLSTDTIKSAGDVLLTGSRAIGALNSSGVSGSTSTGSVVVTIPSSTPLGTYHMIFCADDLHVVAETNETNNCLVTLDTMSLTSPAFDPTVALKPSGRSATVIVLATCTEGAQAHLTVSITQGDAFGEGNGIGQCTGNPGRYPITVPAQGSARFVPGSAEVHGEAIIKDRGEVLDDHTWIRVLNLVLTPGRV